mmetsp:Transcript_41059/g.94678  ORF Transcript_41059/g.94678 Transcript_41059/m.94678 type:complete len:81 (-) Transcript_41059:778-1020(-)
MRVSLVSHARGGVAEWARCLSKCQHHGCAHTRSRTPQRHAAVYHAPRVAKVAMKVSMTVATVATKGSIYSLLPMMERKTL